MLVGEFYGATVFRLATAGAVGISAVMGGLDGCGGGEPGRPPAPVPTGGEVRDGDASRCQLILGRSGDNFTAHAQVNGTIPGGSELVYKVQYQATIADGSYETSETRVPAEQTVTALGVITVNNKPRKFFGFSGKIDLRGKNINLQCGSTNLDDLR